MVELQCALTGHIPADSRKTAIPTIYLPIPSAKNRVSCGWARADLNHAETCSLRCARLVWFEPPWPMHCSSRSSSQAWARADLNREDFAPLVLWVHILSATQTPLAPRFAPRSRRQKWARADLNHVHFARCARSWSRSNPVSHADAAGSSLRSSQSPSEVGPGGFEPPHTRCPRHRVASIPYEPGALTCLSYGPAPTTPVWVPSHSPVRRERL
jgi:hypothetical protein